MSRIFVLAAAGALGALLRYGSTLVVQRLSGTSFPLGTFGVNMAGCFFFGLVWGVAEQRLALPATVRLALLTGFLGAFTTFSAFAFDSMQLLRQGHWLMAVCNIAGQNILGVLLLYVGVVLGR